MMDERIQIGARPGQSETAAPAPRRRVLHLIHTMAYGGVETALLNWICAMDRQRFEVHLACFANPGQTETPFVEAAQARGLEVARIPWGRRKPLLKASLALRQFIWRHRIDILHTHNWYADYVGALTARLTRVKTVTTLYVWSDFDWKRNILQALDKFAIRFFDQITAHCEDTRAKTIRLGFPPERVGLLTCGYELNPVALTPRERQERRHRLGVAEGDIVLANVARFYPEKAQDGLLRSFRQIHTRQPRTRLWMLGVGPLEEELRALCHRLELDSAVTFLGFVKDLHGLLPLVDIQVHPSHMEGVPLAVLSGMATGLPIVASRVGGLQEVLTHEQNSLLIPAGDEEGFCGAVLRLIENPDEGRRLGQAAREFVERQYSLRGAVRRVEETYDRMMEPCAPGFLS